MLRKNREVYVYSLLLGNLSRDLIRSSGILVIRGYYVRSVVLQIKANCIYSEFY